MTLKLRLATLAAFTFMATTYAQVGINTTTPANGAMLDVTSTDKGMLVPRVDIADLSTIAPITGGSTESLLVYNTNTTTGTGFYYWDSSNWVLIGDGEFWSLQGNAGTNPGTGAGQNYVGTSDSQDLVLAANGASVAVMSTAGQIEASNDGTETAPSLTFSGDLDSGIYRKGTNSITLSTGGNDKFTVPNVNQVYAEANGINSAPFYSWSEDTDLGIWRSADDRLNFTAGGREFMEMAENGVSSVLTINDGAQNTDFKVEGTTDPNLIFANAGNNNVGIGIPSPAAINKLEVYSGTRDAVFGYSDNVGGVLGRESNISFGVPTQTILGAGVYANNPNAGYTSVFSQSTGSATVAASVNYSDIWIASYNYVDNPSTTVNPPATYNQLNITGTALGGIKTANRSITLRGALADNGIPGSITAGFQTTAVARNEETHGLYAMAVSRHGRSSDGNFTSGTLNLNVDYNSGALRSFAMAGAYYNSTDYKILGSGAVSTVVEDENNEQRIMFAPEAPEVLLQDFGTAKLVNGRATILIDPILTKNIKVDADHPLKVFVQLEGDCNGVYVTRKSQSGFTVVELQNGTSNIDFSWQLVASRADRKAGGRNNATESKFQDLRFPVLKKDFAKSIDTKDFTQNATRNK